MYPSNLRINFEALAEDECVAKARTSAARPPMPSFKVRAMSETGPRAL